MKNNNNSQNKFQNLIKTFKLAGIIASVIILAFSAIITFFPDVLVSWPQIIDAVLSPEPKTYDDQIVFFDVGQADCTAVMSNGEIALVDLAHVGGGGKNITQSLKAYATENIKYIVLTHYHTDHIGALEIIAQNFNIDTVIMNNYYSMSDTDLDAIQKLHSVIDDYDIKLEYAANNKILSVGDFNLKLHTTGLVHEEENENSTVVSVEGKGVNALLMADSESEIMSMFYSMHTNFGADISYDILKVAHHGANDSNNLEFLKLVAPKYAVISCGKDNLYGHPHTEVLENLDSINANVFRTDSDGEITIIITDNKQIKVSTTR